MWEIAHGVNGKLPDYEFLLELGKIPRMETYVERIQKRIDELGISRNAVERQAGLSKNYLRDILDRGRKPGLDKIAPLCKALDATPDELFPELEALYSERQLKYIRETNKADRKIRALEKELKD